jgi:hypothetical protein
MLFLRSSNSQASCRTEFSAESSISRNVFWVFVQLTRDPAAILSGDRLGVWLRKAPTSVKGATPALRDKSSGQCCSAATTAQAITVMNTIKHNLAHHLRQDRAMQGEQDREQAGAGMDNHFSSASERNCVAQISSKEKPTESNQFGRAAHAFTGLPVLTPIVHCSMELACALRIDSASPFLI